MSKERSRPVCKTLLTGQAKEQLDFICYKFKELGHPRPNFRYLVLESIIDDYYKEMLTTIDHHGALDEREARNA